MILASFVSVSKYCNKTRISDRKYERYKDVFSPAFFHCKGHNLLSSDFSPLRWWIFIDRHCVDSVVVPKTGVWAAGGGEGGLSIFVAAVICVDINLPCLLFSVCYRLLVNFNPQ